MIGFFREHVIKRFVRSPKWSKVRKSFLKTHDRCAICGKLKNLQVHHKKPVHLFPHLELDKNNLITLCSRHHFIFGHLENWRKFNEDIIYDVKFWRKRLGKDKDYDTFE